MGTVKIRATLIYTIGVSHCVGVIAMQNTNGAYNQRDPRGIRLAYTVSWHIGPIYTAERDIYTHGSRGTANAMRILRERERENSRSLSIAYPICMPCMCEIARIAKF